MSIGRLGLYAGLCVATVWAHFAVNAAEAVDDSESTHRSVSETVTFSEGSLTFDFSQSTISDTGPVLPPIGWTPSISVDTSRGLPIDGLPLFDPALPMPVDPLGPVASWSYSTSQFDMNLNLSLPEPRLSQPASSNKNEGAGITVGREDFLGRYANLGIDAGDVGVKEPTPSAIGGIGSVGTPNAYFSHFSFSAFHWQMSGPVAGLPGLEMPPTQLAPLPWADPAPVPEVAGMQPAIYYEPTEQDDFALGLDMGSNVWPGISPMSPFDAFASQASLPPVPVVPVDPTIEHALYRVPAVDEPPGVAGSSLWQMDVVQFSATFTGSWLGQSAGFGPAGANLMDGISTIDPHDPHTGDLLDSPTVAFESSRVENHIRIEGGFETRSDWAAGMVYTDIRRSLGQTPSGARGDGPLAGPVLATRPNRGGFFGGGLPNNNSTLPIDLEHLALFMEYTHHLSERLSLTVGGQYFDIGQVRLNLGESPWYNGDMFNQLDSVETDGFNPRFMTSFSLTEALKWNFQMARGYLPSEMDEGELESGICTSGDLSIYGRIHTYQDEYSWNYETGISGSWRRASFSAAAFQATVEDLYVPLDGGSCASSLISNDGSDGHARGLEFELNTLLSDELQLSLAMSRISSVFEDRLDASVRDSFGNWRDGGYASNVPRTQFASVAKYTLPRAVFGSARVYVSLTMHYVSDRVIRTESDGSELNVGQGSPLNLTAHVAPAYHSLTGLGSDSRTLMGLKLGVVKPSWETVVYLQNHRGDSGENSASARLGSAVGPKYGSDDPRKLGVYFRRSF